MPAIPQGTGVATPNVTCVTGPVPTIQTTQCPPHHEAPSRSDPHQTLPASRRHRGLTNRFHTRGTRRCRAAHYRPNRSTPDLRCETDPYHCRPAEPAEPNATLLSVAIPNVTRRSLPQTTAPHRDAPSDAEPAIPCGPSRFRSIDAGPAEPCGANVTVPFPPNPTVPQRATTSLAEPAIRRGTGPF